MRRLFESLRDTWIVWLELYPVRMSIALLAIIACIAAGYVTWRGYANSAGAGECNAFRIEFSRDLAASDAELRGATNIEAMDRCPIYRRRVAVIDKAVPKHAACFDRDPVERADTLYAQLIAERGFYTRLLEEKCQ